jgi:hypothetical protein
MMSNSMSIKLAHWIPPQGGEALYKVVTIKNSTMYHPGQALFKSEVDGLCRNNKWDVTVVQWEDKR